MSYELVVRSCAKADIRRAAKWYEKQREGLGADFVSEVDNAIRRIEANPEQFQVIYQDIRHAITRRFPYGVFYRIRKTRIESLLSYISSGRTFPGRANPQVPKNRANELEWTWPFSSFWFTWVSREKPSVTLCWHSRTGHATQPRCWAGGHVDIQQLWPPWNVIAR